MFCRRGIVVDGRGDGTSEEESAGKADAAMISRRPMRWWLVVVGIVVVACVLAFLPHRTQIPPLVESDYCYLLLAADRARGCYHAVPLAPRKRPHARAGAVDYREAKGVFFLQDVHLGPGRDAQGRACAEGCR